MYNFHIKVIDICSCNKSNNILQNQISVRYTSGKMELLSNNKNEFPDNKNR